MCKIMRFGLASALVFLLASWAMAQPGVVMGTVTDTSGVGIDSAYVTLSHCCGGGGGGGGQVLYSTYTGEDGSYLFPAVTPDSYKIKATKTGYGMAMQNIMVPAGGTLVVNLVLSGGCGGGGGGCPHDTLEVVSVAGYAIVDTGGMCQDLYYLDVDSNGVADYQLNFGPPWYDPGSGAQRPEDGDWCTIVGGLVEMTNPDMIIVYEINGLWWRDPATVRMLRRHHWGGQGGGQQDGRQIVAKPQISGFFPNPFNPETTVSFALPEAGPVNLAVYNLKGEKVADLVNGSRDAGQHQVTWRAGNLSSGIYLFRLEAGATISVKRVVFVK